MNHSFNITLASRYGIEEAIMIEQVYWWIHKNECDEEETMIKNGRVWCRSSARGFNKYIPYMNPQKIRRVLKSLEGKVFISGNFNNKATNQTLWYTFSDEFKKELEALDYDFSKMKNGIFKNEKSNNIIINNNLKEENIIEEKEKNKTNVLSKKGSSSTRFVKPTVEQIDAYIKEKKYHFTADHFYNYYESKGWRVGNSPMKNWKAACATWECKRKSEKPAEQIDEQSTGLPDGMTEEKWTEIVLFLASRVYFISSRITPMMFVRMKELANGDSPKVMKILYQIEEKAINEGIDSFDIMTVYGELVNADRDE